MQTRERPVLFSAPMIQAILAGRKTQTRRVVKPQPHHGILSLAHIGDFWKPCWGEFMDRPENQDEVTANNSVLRCPYGQPGDRLWVKEAYLPDPPRSGEWEDFGGDFRLDDIPECYRSPQHVLYRATWTGHELKWRPSIHCPRWASRIALEVTDVRVERLNALHGGDTAAEGIDCGLLNGQMVYHEGGFQCVGADPVIAFRALWDSINGKTYPWDANPFVWVVSFKRMEATHA